MIRYSVVAFVFCVFVASAAWNASAETFALQDKACQRNLRVVRHYEIVAQQGNPTVAALPALMSFWGATNWQLVSRLALLTVSNQTKRKSHRTTLDSRAVITR